MRLAAAGAPNRMLTLTCAPLAEPDPDKARALLHKTWRILRLTIAREFIKRSPERWSLQRNRPQSGRRGVRCKPSATGSAQRPASLPYFAVVERHKSGRPHLHILLRSGYIPQQWLSAQMKRLAASPICDIRKVNGGKQAAAYVAKYIGKAPARFTGARAYWYTRNWAPPPAPADEPTTTQQQWFRARSRRWCETLAELNHRRPGITVTTDGWFTLHSNPFPYRPFVSNTRCSPIWRRAHHPDKPGDPPDC